MTGIQMQNYLKSKVAYYNNIFSWFENKIESLEKDKNTHKEFLIFVRRRIVELKRDTQRLEVIASVRIPSFQNSGIRNIHVLESEINNLTIFYLSTLQRENSQDVFIRNVILNLKERYKLTWINDIFARSDSSYATWLGFEDYPIFYLPPQQEISLHDIPAIYHEIGHNIFVHYPEIADNLNQCVFDYFQNLKQNTSQMAPDKVKNRNQEINYAIKYWNISRLNELFSDVYATYLCGPAYHHLWVDMTFRTGSNPFLINPCDEHPPMATRVQVCFETLTPIYKNDGLINNQRSLWMGFISKQPKIPEFDLFCNEQLIKNLVDESIKNIERLFPHIHRYNQLFENFQESDEIIALSRFDEIVNYWTKLILTSSKDAEKWEIRVLNKLKKQM